MRIYSFINLHETLSYTLQRPTMDGSSLRRIVAEGWNREVLQPGAGHWFGGTRSSGLMKARSFVSEADAIAWLISGEPA